MPVLHYFSESPFFDVTSNNATLKTQATYNPSMLHIIQTREAFEDRLRTMQGLEFMVAYEPKQPTEQVAGVAEVHDSGVWVIRKQIRRKRQGYEDEVTVLSFYFVIGENIYMSPSVANVIGSRLVRNLSSHLQLIDLTLKAILSYPLSHPLQGFFLRQPRFHCFHHRWELSTQCLLL